MPWLFSRKHLERVKHAWGAGTIWAGGDIQHWLQHPAVQERINYKVSGAPGVNRFEYFLDRYLKGRMPIERALTLGSGVGELERGLAKYNFAGNHEGVDLSEDAIRAAMEKAGEAGLAHLRYRAANLNTIALEPSAYDVIFGVSSVHHVQSLEHLFEQVRLALKPEGYFFLDEYVGPSRFQWTEQQLRLMNEQLRILPKDLRRSIGDDRKYKERIVRKSIDEILLADPSEAIRSAEILPLLPRYFDVIEVRGYGGSLLHELLYDIAGNFHKDNPGSLERLGKLFELEDDLIAQGALGHDFAVIVARAKAAA
jgi:SAM-dependent methyltransferase